jgi:hypothetical protein
MALEGIFFVLRGINILCVILRDLITGVLSTEPRLV